MIGRAWSAGCASAVLILCGCGESSRSEATRWPAGTAVAVCGVTIPREEVERTADALAEVNPAWTRRAMLREAVVAQLIPRAAARGTFPVEYEDARARCELDLAALRSGAADAPSPERAATATLGLSFDVWSRARELAPGEWHGPFEGMGRWLALRVLARERGATRTLDSYEVEIVLESFLPAAMRLDELVEACELAIVDPEFEDLVPLSVRSAMRRADG